MIKEAIDKIKAKEDLSREEMEAVFAEIMGGKLSTDEIASFLIALSDKGETADEITGAASVMRKFSTKINTKRKDVIDTCGTGGDNASTFNISTVSAFAACGAGCAVAKHGNKSVSSNCGSANVLEELGVNIRAGKEIVEKCLDEIGIGFLFAPDLHLAMKYAMPARQKIKTRTIFNIIGPLTNPAGAKKQIIGVFEKSLIKPVIQVLKNLGSVHAMVVCGDDGLDEITITTKTHVAELKDNEINPYIIDPPKYGMNYSKLEDLKGKDASYNAEIALDVLKGKKSPRKNIVLINAGCAIYIANKAKDIEEGIRLAEESIDSGKALEKLEKLKELTNEKP